MAMSNYTRLVPVLALGGSVFFLLLLASQYLFSATFPVGGDAARYITVTRTFLNAHNEWDNVVHILKHEWYFLAYFLLSLTAWLPTEWPIRFILWAVFGQIAIGIALGMLLYRIAGWRGAAAGIALWGITPFTAHRHFEDGTIAQLWSYFFLLLFFERWLRGSWIWAMLFFVATILTHPVSGLILIVTLGVSLLPTWIIRSQLLPRPRRVLRFVALGYGILGLCLLVLFWRRQTIIQFVSSQQNRSYETPFDFIEGIFVPILWLAIPGIAVLWNKLLRHPHFLVLLVAFTGVVGALNLNASFGDSVWIPRVIPYFIILCIMSAACVIPFLLRKAFPFPSLRGGVAVLLFTFLGLSTWNHNTQIYAFYESPSRYARIHPDEIAAIEWAGTHLPPDSSLVTSTVNRHSEWIPVLTNLHWLGKEERELLDKDYLESLKSSRDQVYLMFFLRREPIPPIVEHNPQEFIPIFRNNGVVIFEY